MRSNCASDRRPPSACRSPRRQSRTVPKTSKLRSAIDMASAVWHGIPVPSRMKFCPSCASPLIARKLDERTRLVCASESCDYVFYDNPAPVVAALVEHGQTVLLVRNKGWPEKWYGLVSGFLEKGESPEDGVLREVREELGLRGDIVSFIGAYAFPENNQVILAYHVRAHGDIELGEELAG